MLARLFPPRRPLSVALQALLGLGGAAAALWGAGCRSEEGHGLMASGREAPIVIRVERAAEPGELYKIVHLPAREIAARIGGFRAAEGSILRATLDGRPAEALDETVRFELDAKGQWHGVRNNSRDEGMEAWWTGGQLAVRLRYGKPVRRRPEGNEIDRLREDIFGAPGAYYDVVERFADLQPGGPTQQLGRPARLVQVRLRGTPRPAAPEPEPGRKWRSQVQVQALTGQVGVDEKTGVPLFVELRARYTYSKGNARAEVDMQVRRELAEIGAVANVAPPTDAIDSPTRTRYEVEKRELLDGLAADRQQSGR